MTVNITIEKEHGVLNVSGETDLETYALQKWFEGWQKKESILHISGVIVKNNDEPFVHTPGNI